MEKEMELAQELNDEELEAVDGGFALVFKRREGCPFCSSRIVLLDRKEKECSWCGRKFDDEGVTDLRYRGDKDDAKITLL